MNRLIPILALIALTASGARSADESATTSDVKASTPVDFDKQIMPLLRRSCVACHHAKEAEGGLVLESFAALLKGGDSGPAIVAKDPQASVLWARVSGAEEPLMPPEDNTIGPSRCRHPNSNC